MAYYSADPEKHEHELYEHVKKAVSNDERAPKQKHVRAISAYTWIHKNSRSIWNSLKVVNLFTSEIQAFKALIMMHSLLRDGHPNVLGEAMKQKILLDTFKNFGNQSGNFGYGTLIRNYVDFLNYKLRLHLSHPKFTGNFGYKDVSVREFDYKSVASFETADLNDGFVTVEELMDLQNAVDAFQKSIFKSLAHGTNNNCRISALVPLVEESYGLYLFITNMLQSLHRDREAWDALGPLRDRYRDQFLMLKRFYDDARKLPYLTSLIIVPRLPDLPPEFYIISEQRHPTSGASNQRAIVLEPPQLLLLDDDGSSTATDNSSIYSTNTPNPNAYSMEEDPLALANARNAELENTLSQYTQRFRSMEQELASLRTALQQGEFSWDRLRQLENELNELRLKYDKLAKAYALLNADFQSLQKTHQGCPDALSQLEAKKREMDMLKRAKDTEIAQMRTTMERLKNEFDLYKLKYHENKEQNEQMAILDAGLDESARRIQLLTTQLADEKKLHRNALSSVLQRLLDNCMSRLKDTQHRLQDPSVGHVTVSPNLALSCGEKTCALSDNLLTSLKAYFSHTDMLSAVSDAPTFTDRLIEFLMQIKGLDDEDHSLVPMAITVGQRAIDYLQSGQNNDTAIVIKKESVFNQSMHDLLQQIDTLSGINKKDPSVDLAHLIEREMVDAARAIDEASKRLLAMMERQEKAAPTMDVEQMNVHASILSAVLAMTKSIGGLIRAATNTQQEIVAFGKGTAAAAQFYKQNHRWTEGLISAAKMVAAATVLLVDVADGVVTGQRSMEDLIAASKEVAAATAQLVAAARVKMVKGSKTQEPLEDASSAVGESVRHLVGAADLAIRKGKKVTKQLDLTKLSLHEMKIREIDVQSKILQLERQTAEERRKLADLRRQGYQETM